MAVRKATSASADCLATPSPEAMDANACAGVGEPPSACCESWLKAMATSLPPGKSAAELAVARAWGFASTCAETAMARADPATVACGSKSGRPVCPSSP